MMPSHTSTGMLWLCTDWTLCLYVVILYIYATDHLLNHDCLGAFGSSEKYM